MKFKKECVLDQSPKGYCHYSKQSKESVLKELNTNKQGLSTKEAEHRLKIYGHNELEKKIKRKPITKFFLKFTNPLVLILLIIIITSLFFDQKISALVIGLMVLLSVIIDFVQEYKADKAMEKLHQLIRTTVSVYRDGKIKEINIKDLVPGDVIELYVGDLIPADLRIISCNDLFINQSALTGESLPIEKIETPIDGKKLGLTELNNIAFMGSSVVSGTGFGVVIKTGISTEFGEISKSIANLKAETSFNKGIKQFTILMIKFMIILIAGIFLINTLFKHHPFIETLLFALAVAVSLTPEMLPMIITINLAKSANEMAKNKVIVKHLDSIQNFGAMDILCTDKTGTLTQDKIILEKHCDVTGKDDESVLKYAYLNSFYQTGLKNVIDKAILRHEKLDVKSYKKIDEIPYNFARKIMSVILDEEKKHLLITKGAPEEIFKRCTHYELNNKIKPITKEILLNVKKEYNTLSHQGFRVLAIAYKPITRLKREYGKNDENNLILKGYAAFLDPAKPSVKSVLESLEKLGIEIKVLTGDNEIITKKICHEVSLKSKGIITGPEIDKLNNLQLKKVVESKTIFARLTPSQKERIIDALHKNNHIVGYLGDGINDAPALKVADVGISVNNAVDIAKESASIILLKKSLEALRNSVIEGRKTFGNITKYIKVSASANFGNMLSMTLTTIFLPFIPMLPIQVLLSNFLFDISQIAIPTDNVDPEYIKKPRPWKIKMIQRFMSFMGPTITFFDLVVFTVLLFIFKAGPDFFHTGWFISSLSAQLLSIYIIRTNKIPFIQSMPSKYLILTTFAILGLIILLPFTILKGVFGFISMPALFFLIILGILIIELITLNAVKNLLFENEIE